MIASGQSREADLMDISTRKKRCRLRLSKCMTQYAISVPLPTLHKCCNVGSDTVANNNNKQRDLKLRKILIKSFKLHMIKRRSLEYIMLKKV